MHFPFSNLEENYNSFWKTQGKNHHHTSTSLINSPWGQPQIQVPAMQSKEQPMHRGRHSSCGGVQKTGTQAPCFLGEGFPALCSQHNTSYPNHTWGSTKYSPSLFQYDLKRNRRKMFLKLPELLSKVSDKFCGLFLNCCFKWTWKFTTSLRPTIPEANT